jgi:hypothetical protein
MIKWSLCTIYFNRNCNFYIWYTALQDAKTSSPLHIPIPELLANSNSCLKWQHKVFFAASVKHPIPQGEQHSCHDQLLQQWKNLQASFYVITKLIKEITSITVTDGVLPQLVHD